MSEEKLLGSWDVTEIAEHRIKYLMEFDEHRGKTEKELYQYVYEDHDFWIDEWNDFLRFFTDHMNERNPDNLDWKATVNGFGWRKRDGYKEPFDAPDGKTLLQEILPDTDNTFWIYEYEEDGIKGFAINNCHHDSPIKGKEWYFIIPTKGDLCG